MLSLINGYNEVNSLRHFHYKQNSTVAAIANQAARYVATQARAISLILNSTSNWHRHEKHGNIFMDFSRKLVTPLNLRQLGSFYRMISATYSFFATLTNIKWQTHQLSAGALDLTIHQAHHTHNVHWTRHQDGTRPTLQPTHKTYKAHQTYQTKHTQGLTKHDPVHSVNYAKAGPFAPLS